MTQTHIQTHFQTPWFNHLERVFRIEHKLFLLGVENGDKSVKFVERNRVKEFHMSVEMGGAIWLCDTTSDVVVYDGKSSFLRTFRGNSYVLMVTINANNRGSFLRINMHRGTVSSIVVPSGNGRSGWRSLHRSLMSLVGRDFMALKGSKDRTKWIGEETHFKGCNGAQKNWSLAVVLYQSSTDVTW